MYCFSLDLNYFQELLFVKRQPYARISRGESREKSDLCNVYTTIRCTMRVTNSIISNFGSLKFAMGNLKAEYSFRERGGGTNYNFCVRRKSSLVSFRLPLHSFLRLAFFRSRLPSLSPAVVCTCRCERRSGTRVVKERSSTSHKR